ncbi:MAG: phosphoglucomutase/phosphomannomutase family protein [Microcystis aeruginosa Ma_QC_Ch_20071001_S25]|jgi:phosphomannomutase|uniref:Phosphoglucomutase/phosphomannomutase family protein n=1 Tax=Microcystis aeruginosa Ma_QC_Ch_20071001_S25D TaxID=2486250 RepID=A0A552FFH2_MICAE|nr:MULTISPECIES: phosphoglucomutase/phosphomannomutase family protein [unclassified Microcystis]MCA2761629.1 phosphoglucomutase/phosphomannomutase family protein [Microcystis sp. M151S2]NCQ85172.1 phosphoglucomutase/phosphomannomutase family protein [Microcystis aeruginosa W13-18]NCR35044.1 phosphoglucomutase/phosphomannomutase family protein [Microcystis aeruginosa S11-05]NCR48501.1 phosphoglucomutase/phosphomannomutase family protein [Microcystis aeruginosa S11-01]TRU44311.1 MAG: phosphogluc
MTTVNPIKFGTDGWRGIIAADFTFDRVALLAPLAAQVLADNYGQITGSRTIIVGYDRRFMAEDFAQTAAESLQKAGFDVLLSQSYAPTPAFSWAARSENALGAIVLTASHNPAKYLGLKVKGYFGGSVSPEITQQIEALLSNPPQFNAAAGKLSTFEPWSSYCQGLRQKVNIAAIANAIKSGQLKVYSDVMHGAAATGLERLLGVGITELRGNRDPLFGGGSPEPLPRNLREIIDKLAHSANLAPLRVGLVFDGDSDRVAAIDGRGNFLSTQNLIPILIEHLAGKKGMRGEIVKTVSGSDLIPKLASLYGLSVFETPIGYKYIADRMLTTPVLIGGEESGGVGYGTHIPERDALLSALYVLEAVVESGQDLSDLYAQLQDKTGFHSEYDRIDLPLANMEARDQLITALDREPLREIAGKQVTDCNTMDGYKFRLEDGSWLLIRFSGTEPVLRLYCESSTLDRVDEILAWAKSWATYI